MYMCVSVLFFSHESMFGNQNKKTKQNKKQKIETLAVDDDYVFILNDYDK